MSLGWVFCTKCNYYRKWEEAPPRDWLRCNHCKIEDVCISGVTPYIRSDDRYESLWDRGLIDLFVRERKRRNKDNLVCICGKVHILDFTFDI